MKHYVIDASVGVKWYIPEPLSDQAAVYLEKHRQGQAVLMSPDLIVVEIGNVMWKKLQNGEITIEEARLIVDAFSSCFPAKLLGSSELLPGALEISFAFGLTIYDSLYLSLAVLAEATLVTADKKLAQSASGGSDRFVPVELLG